MACSTPLGVTDFVTVAQLLQRPKTLVCSTPLGVPDFVTPDVKGDGAALHRAQHVSASLTSSRRRHPGSGARPSRPPRLSASLTSSRTPGSLSPWSAVAAQRLSASLTSSQRIGEDQRYPLRMCSTPLGVTDFVTTRR